MCLELREKYVLILLVQDLNCLMLNYQGMYTNIWSWRWCVETIFILRCHRSILCQGIFSSIGNGSGPIFFLRKKSDMLHVSYFTYESRHDKTNKLTCAPSKDSDQPGHPPSLIRVITVRSMGSQGPKLSSCGQRWLWSDWADAQADLSLHWAHMPFCWFCHEAAHISMYEGG